MNPCINIYDPVMTNLTHNFSAASPVYPIYPDEKLPIPSLWLQKFNHPTILTIDFINTAVEIK